MNKINLETSTEIPADFDFNEEFQQAFDAIEHTKNSIFITGKAGTGKSTLLEYFRKNTKKNIVVLAPTGVAAIKARGQTIHSFFKFPPRFIQQDHIKKLRNKKLLEKLDTIVIDECSMIRADLLDGIDYALRINRKEHKKPFGGVQIILFGDLFQLPPVVEKDIRHFINHLYASPYFFSANVMSKIAMKCVELHKIYRQKEESFISLLNRIRTQEASESDLEHLNRQVSTEITQESDTITLTTTNADANALNETRLLRIRNKEFEYHADINGKFDARSYPVEESIQLKKNAQIMLVKNDSSKRWTNGTIAEIAELSDSSMSIRIDDDIYDVPKVSWDKIQYIYNEAEQKIEEKVIGSFQQYPVKLAWAITIHKSQGQTFKNVIIDMGYGAFAHGQTYVALSRCTSLKGLILKKPIIFSDIIFDSCVYQFHESFR